MIFIQGVMKIIIILQQPGMACQHREKYDKMNKIYECRESGLPRLTGLVSSAFAASIPNMRCRRMLPIQPASMARDALRSARDDALPPPCR